MSQLHSDTEQLQINAAWAIAKSTSNPIKLIVKDSNLCQKLRVARPINGSHAIEELLTYGRFRSNPAEQWSAWAADGN